MVLLTSMLSQNIITLKGGPFRRTHCGKIFEKKSHNAETKLKGDPLVSPGIVRYVEKGDKLFRFSSQGQMILFGTIKFPRTFKNYTMAAKSDVQLKIKSSSVCEELSFSFSTGSEINHS